MNTPVPDPPKNCLDCPALLIAPGQQSSMIHKNVGAPVCSRYGKVIGSAKSKINEQRKIGEVYAKDCPSFGQPVPLSISWDKMELRVALPDPTALLSDDQRIDPATVDSCRMCSNFVREDMVANQMGYMSGVCAAKGKLILASRMVHEARGCTQSSLGQVRESTSGLTMLPEYSQAVRGDADVVRNHQLIRSRGLTDPVDYVTDKPVSEEDKQSGIRAWRGVYDPVSENEVYLPIFDIEYFSPDEQAKIPRTGDEEHPELYVDHHFYTYKVGVLWEELDETPALWGAPGTGKTELFRHMAWLMCLPFERFNVTARTELEDYAGKMMYSPERGTYFQYGRFVKAWIKPGILGVDEPNAARDEFWHFLRPLIDNSKQLVLDMNDGERLTRNKSCYLGMAMNPPWDARNSGVKPIADADARRIHHMHVELPPVEIERDIVSDRVKVDGWNIPNDKLQTIMNIGQDIRALVRDDELPISWGISMQIKVARMLKWFDFYSAYRMAAGDFLEPEAMETLIGVVKTHVDR